MLGKIPYKFSAQTWQHAAPGGWYFVTLPLEVSTEIRTHFKWQEEGWGRLKVLAKIGSSEWETAIWFDTKRSSYLLPLKAVIRKKEGIEVNQTIQITLLV